jgi:ABC-type uncharacterized transport system substrate-binding protein
LTLPLGGGKTSPNIILTNTTPAAVALQRETRAIPIVFVNVADPVASGLVPRLNRPSGNVTASSLTRADKARHFPAGSR